MKFVFPILCLFLLVPLVSAERCDSFCLGKEYDYGTCRETTETGFCEGKAAEDVYSFALCSNFERCCCGFGSEGSVSNGSVSFINDSFGNSSAVIHVAKESPSFAHSAFGYLLVLVVLLALGVIIKKKAFRREEIIEK